MGSCATKEVAPTAEQRQQQRQQRQEQRGRLYRSTSVASPPLSEPAPPADNDAEGEGAPSATVADDDVAVFERLSLPKSTNAATVLEWQADLAKEFEDSLRGGAPAAAELSLQRFAPIPTDSRFEMSISLTRESSMMCTSMLGASAANDASCVTVPAGTSVRTVPADSAVNRAVDDSAIHKTALPGSPLELALAE